MLKKAAMFGLDARIALAIFGALSVISGAALYSAIQESKAMRYARDIEEIIKSIEALYLDLGAFPVFEDSTKNYYDLRYLYSNPGNNSYWKGPYVTKGEVVSSVSSYLNIQRLNNIVVNHRIGLQHPTSCSGALGSTTDHFLVFFNPYTTSFLCNFKQDLAKNIHDILDTDGDYTSGKIVVPINGTASTVVSYNLNFLPMPKQ